MKARLALRVGAVLTLAAAVVGIAVQRIERTQLEEQGRLLAEQAQEAERLARDNAELPRLQAEAAALGTRRAEAREVEKLRTEVLRLREQVKERERLLAEKQRLAGELGRPAARLAQMPDYVAATNFVEAGLATPEAALLTFFRAAQAGDVHRMLACMPPEVADDLRAELEQTPEHQRTKALHEMTAPFRVQGYRIASKEPRGEDQMVIRVQLATGGDLHPLTFRRVGGEWRLAP